MYCFSWFKDGRLQATLWKMYFSSALWYSEKGQLYVTLLYMIGLFFFFLQTGFIVKTLLRILCLFMAVNVFEGNGILQNDWGDCIHICKCLKDIFPFSIFVCTVNNEQDWKLFSLHALTKMLLNQYTRINSTYSRYHSVLEWARVSQSELEWARVS